MCGHFLRRARDTSHIQSNIKTNDPPQRISAASTMPVDGVIGNLLSITYSRIAAGTCFPHDIHGRRGHVVISVVENSIGRPK